MADSSTDRDQVSRAPDRTRRAFLAAGAVLVAGAAGGGVALGRSGGKSAPKPLQPEVRAPLVRAAIAEMGLIAAAAGAMHAAHGDRRAVLRVVHSNHVAHLAALRAAIAGAAYPARTPRIRTRDKPPPGTLVAAEARAARVAARRALQLTGAPSALLASISACEASHAELLA